MPLVSIVLAGLGLLLVLAHVVTVFTMWSLSTPVLASVLVKLLSAGNRDRARKLMAVAGDGPAATGFRALVAAEPGPSDSLRETFRTAAAPRLRRLEVTGRLCRAGQALAVAAIAVALLSGAGAHLATWLTAGLALAGAEGAFLKERRAADQLEAALDQVLACLEGAPARNEAES